MSQNLNKNNDYDIGKLADYYGKFINESEFLEIEKIPKDSFVLKIDSNKHKEVFLFENDFLIVNPNLLPGNHNLIVVEFNKEIIIKNYLEKANNYCELYTDNKDSQAVRINLTQNQLKIIGVVVSVFNKMH